MDLSNSGQLKELGCSSNKLTNLDCSNCQQLEYLWCMENQLTHLDLRQNKKLIKIECSQNQLSQLTFPPQLTSLEKLDCYGNFLTDLNFTALSGEKLTKLSLGNNNFSLQDLNCLAKFTTNLRKLSLGNWNLAKHNEGIYNRWTGSLEPLQNMKQLHTLAIGNTDLDSGTEYLPARVMEIGCDYSLRPDSKVRLIAKELEQNSNFMLASSFVKTYLKKKLDSEIVNQLKNFNYEELTLEQEKLLTELIPSKEWRKRYKKNGLCDICQQINGDGEWCQPCNLPHLQANFANWTSGNPEIDRFIQKCQLEARNGNNMLEWIPYEQLINIEYLAEGGFSKIYKAKWVGVLKGWSIKGNKWERWGNIDIVLKILTDSSQNMTVDFLQEVINNKLTIRDEYSHIVNCFGISREPKTENYVMVMDYISGGNLRQFLQSNYQQLSFPIRLFQLFQIAQGLQFIHEANLVHQDLHAGNVLNYISSRNVFNSLITDLGLSQPANETDNSKVYGVLPYVAPEVLSGETYTQASDIYSLGMIAYELFSNKPPLTKYAYDSALALRICEGLRPNLGEVIAPQLLKGLISRCWDADPEQRPTVSEIWNILGLWLDIDLSVKKRTEFYHQYQELVDTKALDSLTNKPPRNYSAGKYTSRLLDYKNLSKPRNSKELNEQFYGGSRSLELTLDLSGLRIQEDSWEESFSDINKWKKINSNFTPELVSLWISHGFTAEQCQDWININSPTQQNLAIQEPKYYAWLRDGKQVNSDWVLNQGNSEQLRQEFRQWEQEQLQTEIQIPPKNNLN